MELFADLEGRQFIRSKAATTPLGTLPLGERVVEPVSLWLLSRPETEGQPLTATALDAAFDNIILCGRDATDLDGDALFTVTDFAVVGAGATLHYQAEANYNTEAIITALTGKKTLEVLVDLEFQSNDATLNSRPIMHAPARLYRDIFRGTEPTPGSGDPVYPLPEALALKTVAGKYRIKADGTFQLWNATQSKWHALTLSGAAGEEILSIGAGE